MTYEIDVDEKSFKMALAEFEEQHQAEDAEEDFWSELAIWENSDGMKSSMQEELNLPLHVVRGFRARRVTTESKIMEEK